MTFTPDTSDSATAAGLRGGLVSISFRALSPRELVELVARAGLAGIEWGGDVHVPHGDEGRAHEVAALTRDAGLCSCAYGSYYRMGVSPAQGLDFEAVLACARILDAPTIRVWAGGSGSAEMDAAGRVAVVADALRVADLAARENRVVALEYHSHTLTDTPESVASLMRELDHPAIRFMWQPSAGRDAVSHLAELRAVLPRLANLHVYQWAGYDRHPLADGAGVWPRYLAEANAVRPSGWALLEFVKDDSPTQLLTDAATLKAWLAMPAGSGANRQTT